MFDILSKTRRTGLARVWLLVDHGHVSLRTEAQTKCIKGLGGGGQATLPTPGWGWGGGAIHIVCTGGRGGACHNAYAGYRRHVTYHVKNIGDQIWVQPPALACSYPVLVDVINHRPDYHTRKHDSMRTHLELFRGVRTWCNCAKISTIELALISNVRFD